MVGKLIAAGADRYAAQFELYNVLNGERLVSQQNLTATSGHRCVRCRTGSPT